MYNLYAEFRRNENVSCWKQNHSDHFLAGLQKFKIEDFTIRILDGQHIAVKIAFEI